MYREPQATEMSGDHREHQRCHGILIHSWIAVSQSRFAESTFRPASRVLHRWRGAASSAGSRGPASRLGPNDPSLAGRSAQNRPRTFVYGGPIPLLMEPPRLRLSTILSIWLQGSRMKLRSSRGQRQGDDCDREGDPGDGIPSLHSIENLVRSFDQGSGDERKRHGLFQNQRRHQRLPCEIQGGEMRDTATNPRYSSTTYGMLRLNADSPYPLAMRRRLFAGSTPC